MKKLMTMTELLAKRNMYSKKIAGYTISGAPDDTILISIITSSTGKTATGIKKEDIENMIKASVDSIESNMDNFMKLTAIKNIVNATTEIRVCGNEYTIAEALAYNNVNVKAFYKDYIALMRRSLDDARKAYKKYNEKQFAEEIKNNYLKAVLTESDAADPKVVEEHLRKFEEKYAIEFVDPCKLEERIKKLSEWYDDFYGSVNYRLSEINTSTYIVVDLDEKENFWRYATAEEIESGTVIESVEE